MADITYNPTLGAISGQNPSITPTSTPTTVKNQQIVSDTSLANQDLSKIQNFASNTDQQLKDQQAKVSATPPPTFNPDVSVMDYLTSKGQPADYSSRATLAAKYGIQNYTGSPQQNTQLLNTLKGEDQKQKEAAADTTKQFENVYGDKGGDKTPPPTTPTPTTPTPTPSDQALTDFTTSMQNINNTIDNAYTNYSNQVNQIQNGTFPLTPDQQAQVNAMQQAFDSMKASQLIANKNYEGGVTQAGISAGRNIYAPEVELGNIKSAIDTGLSKIRDIESRAIAAISDLKQGFQDKNYKMITDAYDRANAALKEKSAEIKTLYDATQAHEKDVRDFQYKQTQDLIDNTLKQAQVDMEKGKFDYQKTQDAITNALNQSKFNLEERKVALQAAQQQMVQGMITAASAKQVGSLSNGQPDPKAQEEFLKSFPPLVQTQIKGLSDYSIDPKSFSTSAKQAQGGLTRGQLMAYAKQYDPSFNEAQFDTRKAFLKSWQAGGTNSVIVSANTAIQHLSELNNIINSVAQSNNKGILTRSYNNLAQFIDKNSANPDIAKFKNTANALAGELAKIYKNSTNSTAAPTEDEIKQQRDEILNLAWGKEGLKGVLSNTLQLMSDRLSSATQNYNYIMGKDPKSVLFPQSQEKLNSLKTDGINVDVSALNPMSKISDDELVNSSVGSTSSGGGNVDFNSMLNVLNNLPQY